MPNDERYQGCEGWELRLLDKKELAALYRSELKKTFPPNELRPLCTIEKLRAEGWYDPLGLFQGHALQGYALMWIDQQGEYPLLDYLGVLEEQRGRGVGAELLRQLQVRYCAAKGILVEVEAPESAADEAERALRERRLDFYRRCGYRETPFDCGLFGVHFKILLASNGPVDEREALEVQRKRYSSHIKPSYFLKYVQIPLGEGEAVRPFPRRFLGTFRRPAQIS